MVITQWLLQTVYESDAKHKALVHTSNDIGKPQIDGDFGSHAYVKQPTVEVKAVELIQAGSLTDNGMYTIYCVYVSTLSTSLTQWPIARLAPVRFCIVTL